LSELERWQDVMLDREERVAELKREVNELRTRLGEPVRYTSAALDDETAEGSPIKVTCNLPRMPEPDGEAG
jgi:hypothetical protein